MHEDAVRFCLHPFPLVRVFACEFLTNVTLLWPMSAAAEKKQSTRILIGLIVGFIFGIVLNLIDNPGFNDFKAGLIKNVLEPFGTVFLRSLFMVVVPLVFFSLLTGVGRLGSVARLGKMGTRLGAYYLITSLIAVVIGQVLVTVIQPGAGLPMELVEEVRSGSAEQIAALQDKSMGVKESLWPGIITTIIPKNIVNAMSTTQMLAIIFTAIVFGSALLKMAADKSRPVLDFADAVSEACVVVVGWIMQIAPYAVAALMAVAVGKFGIELLRNLALYVMTVSLALLIHFFGTYQIIVRFVLRYPYGVFLRKIVPVVTTAFSTSSSSATMPTTIRTANENFGVKKEVSSFCIPLGTTVNMDGTALFECVAALFIAQVFGIEITLGGQVALALLIVVSSIGVAGVPGGSIPILMSAMAMLGIPAEGIALILGVDRLLDMARTTLNVTGDLGGALFVSKAEGDPLITTEETEA